MKNNKNKKWSRFHHRVILSIAKVIIGVKLKTKFNFKYDKYDKKKGPALIISNHQTGYDQFFPYFMFGLKTYCVGTDDLLSNGLSSKLLTFAVKMIPFKKSSVDVAAIRNCMKVINEGCNVVLFPEGNRTYSGRTEYIIPSIPKLVKLLKCRLVIVNFHGGFAAFPRFAKKPRKANITCKIKQELSYEDYKDLSNEELLDLIQKGIYVNEYDEEFTVKTKKPAEYLEMVLYRCPTCGITHFESNKDKIKCLTCNKEYMVDNHYKFIDAPFKTITDWYDYQTKEILNDNITSYKLNHLFTSDTVSLYKVIPYKKKELLNKDVTINLYYNRIELVGKEETKIIYFDDINSACCVRKNFINLLTDDTTYMIKSDLHFNAIKYVHFIYKYKIEKGDIKNEYLGL